MRSLTILGACVFAAAAALGCDSPKPPVTAPPQDTSSPPGSSTEAPAGTTAPSAAPSPSQAASAEPAASGDPTSSPPRSSRPELRWTGTFTSPSCGARKYERRITLKEDKTFSALDNVAPCPPKVQCIWAGIVAWSGTWTLDDKGAVLTKTAGGNDPTKKANTDAPLRLVLDKATSSPAEVSDSGATCVYTRVTEGSEKP